MKKVFLLLLISLFVLSLCACAQPEVVIEAQEIREIEVESPSPEKIESPVETPEEEEAPASEDESESEKPSYIKAKGLAEEAEKFEAESPLNSDSSLSQAEMNEASAEIYKKWDDCLNKIWTVLKEELPADEMKALTAEELQWIKEKEYAVMDAGKEYEGGSMRPLIENGKAAELTRDRVYILIEYLK